MIDLDVKKLKTFIWIAEERSFTAAAERLMMSQSWVSEQMKLLEEMLNLPLVERVKGKFVRLTSDGRDLLPIAKRVVGIWEDARLEVEALRGRESARLVLGTDVVTLYMPERNQLITDFMATMPGLEFQIVNEQPRELFDGLKSGRFDLILTLCPHPNSEIEILPLYEHELKLFVPKTVVRQPAYHTPGGVSGGKVLVLQDSYHPAFFSWLRSAFEPAGFQWAFCPETSFHALLRYAVMLRMPTLSPDFSSQIPEMMCDMEVRPIKMPSPVTVRWALMRGQGHRRRAAEKFWQMAARSRPAAPVVSIPSIAPRRLQRSS